MLRMILELALAAPLGGCTLIAAPRVGAVVEHDCAVYGRLRV